MGWEGKSKVLSCRCLFFHLGPWDRLHAVLDQKIPDWLIKIKLLGKVETSIRSGIKSKRQGPYGVSLIRRLIMSTLQMKNKITVICKTDQIAQMASCYLTGAYLLKAVRPPDSRLPATWPSLSENFSLVGWKKDSVRKRECWFSLRASHPLFSSNKFPFLAWLPGLLFFSALTSH